MKNRLLLALIPVVCLFSLTELTQAESKQGAEVARSEQATPTQTQRGVDAPSATGRIAGTLKDPSGAVVSGGKIEVKHLTSGLTRSLETDVQGRFVFESLPVGRYQATASAAGFETAVRTNITVTAGGEAGANVAFKIAPAKTVVEVQAQATELGAETTVAEKVRTSDTTSLLSGVPGVDVYTNGGVSSLPVIHGLADDRVKVLVNGMSIASHCSNHMNPSLSYIAPGNVETVNVLAGITPVSNGGDSIGGTIVVDSVAPQFAAPGQRAVTHGGLTGFHRTNGVVSGGDASISAATEHFSAGYVGTYVNSSDYKNGAGALVQSTLYESRTYNLQLAARRGNNLLVVGLGYQDIPYEGFVNAHMDMLQNESKFANLRYLGTFGWGKLDGRVFYEHTDHEMNLLSAKTAIMNMNMPMDTKGANLGYSLKADIPLSARDVLRVGTELHRFTLDDWWPATMMMVGSMGPDTLWNIHDGRRDHFGTYVEWQGKHGRGWTELLGFRNDVVVMNTGNVAGYNMVPTQKGSAAYYADATAFNSVDHERVDNNFDLTALARYEPGSKSTIEFGYARKTRSPSLYERYLWVKQSAMSVDMNGWFGDLNGYTGNLNLRPEVANTVSFTAGWHDAAKNRWALKITPYFTYVQDYIDVGRCPVSENGLGNGCTFARFNGNNATLATVPYITLQFGNYDARLAGIDASGRIPLGGSTKLGDFALTGILSYVHGKNTAAAAPGSPGQEPLYHLMPVNAKVGVEHHRGNWSNVAELQAVDAKHDIQTIRLEQTTPGYALVNLRTSYQWHLVERTSLRLDAGIDNVAAHNYALPLGGRYYGTTMTAIMMGTSVPGMGRNSFAGLTFQF